MVTTAGGCISNTGSTATGVLYTNSRGLSIDFTAVCDDDDAAGLRGQARSSSPSTTAASRRPACPGTPSTCSPGSNQNLTAAAIYSTQAGGSFAVINGVTMNQPSAVGMRDCSFNNAFFTGPLDAAASSSSATPYDPVAGGPFHLDNFPDSVLPPERADADAQGRDRATLRARRRAGTIAILGRADFQTPGGFIDRYSTLAFGVCRATPDLFIDLVGINNPSFLIAPFFLAPYGQNAAAQSLFNGGPGVPRLEPDRHLHGHEHDPAGEQRRLGVLDGPDAAPRVGAVPVHPHLPGIGHRVAFRLSDAISFEFN